MTTSSALPPLVAIVGPTASGKSALGIFLGKEFGGEVIACDSTQLYRGFDIGTAKPSLVERASIPIICSTFSIQPKNQPQEAIANAR